MRLSSSSSSHWPHRWWCQQDGRTSPQQIHNCFRIRYLDLEEPFHSMDVEAMAADLVASVFGNRCCCRTEQSVCISSFPLMTSSRYKGGTWPCTSQNGSKHGLCPPDHIFTLCAGKGEGMVIMLSVLTSAAFPACDLDTRVEGPAVDSTPAGAGFLVGKVACDVAVNLCA